MPLPKPSEGETESDFVSRCMGSDEARADFPDNDQRLAVCFSKFREGKEFKEAFHIRGTHWEPVPEGGSCPSSHPNKIGSRCYTGDAAAALRQSKQKESELKEQAEPPKNLRNMTVGETLAMVSERGSKLTQQEANFVEVSPSPERACGVCRFYLRNPDGSTIGACQVVEGPIPWFATSDLYISAADEASFAFQARAEMNENKDKIYESTKAIQIKAVPNSPN